MIKLDRETVGMIEVTGAFALAGSSIVAGKFLSGSVPLFTTAFFSLLFALTMLIPLQIRNWRELKKIRSRELMLMVLQALTGIVLTRFFTLYGLKHTSAISAGMINSSTPAVMALMSYFFLRESPGKWVLRGLLMVLIGLFIFSADRGSKGIGVNSLFGNILIFGAVLAEVALSLIRKKSSGHINSLTNTTVLFLIALVIFFPFALSEWQTFSLRDIAITQWIALLYYGLGGSALAYVLWGSGVLKVPGSKTGIAFAMIPITSISLSALILNEEVGLLQLAGLTLCIAGMVLSSKVEVAKRRTRQYDVSQ